MSQPLEKRSDMKVTSGYLFVNTQEGLTQLTESMKAVPRVAFDMEADGLHHYFEKVCLMQLSLPGANYIVDPLAGMDLGDFLKELARKELIIHAADFDLRMLKKTFSFRPQEPVFDTMLAAQVLGYDRIGLAALVQKFFGVVLPKTAQKSDWSRRPLPAGLLEYASDDTKYLEAIAAEMLKSLDSLGRVSWHRECCARVVVNAVVTEKDDAREPWRIKGSSRLAPQVLLYVKALWHWRDTEARKRDRPAFMIMNNEDLTAFAQWRSQHLKETVSQKDFAFLRRYDAEFFKRFKSAVEEADVIPVSEWPGLAKKTVWPAAKLSHEKLEPLMEACKKIAEELKIESCFLAPRAALTSIAQHKPLSLEKVMEVSGLMKWQAELLLPKIQTVLQVP